MKNNDAAFFAKLCVRFTRHSFVGRHSAVNARGSWWIGSSDERNLNGCSCADPFRCSRQFFIILRGRVCNFFSIFHFLITYCPFAITYLHHCTGSHLKEFFCFLPWFVCFRFLILNAKDRSRNCRQRYVVRGRLKYRVTSRPIRCRAGRRCDVAPGIDPRVLWSRWKRRNGRRSRIAPNTLAVVRRPIRASHRRHRCVEKSPNRRFKA